MGSLPLSASDGIWSESPSWDIAAVEYPKASQAPFPIETAEIKGIAEAFLNGLNLIFAEKAYTRLQDVMNSESSFWRDHLCFNDTKFQTLSGAKEVIALIQDRGCAIESISLDREPKKSQIDLAGNVLCIQSFITIKTKIGTGRGLMKLIQDVNDEDRWKLYTIYTGLWELNGYSEKDVTGLNRPYHATPEDLPSSMNWQDYTDQKEQCLDEEPAVLIVGAGHCGMMTAARLGILGVKSLIIDTHARTGDSWRTRYRHLCLHDGCWMNTMPYLPYPPNWPVYCAKDKMANFLESYASIMELNIWNSTSVVESAWDSEKKRWTVVLESLKDGRLVRTTFHPRHLVQSTGLNGAPRIPAFLGLKEFKGRMIHSSEFHGATEKDYAGKRVIVVGSGNSAHDIAYDIHMNGGKVTMVQRGTTFVKTASTNLKDVASLYNEHTPLDDSDITLVSSPIGVAKRFGYDLGAVSAELDKPILDGLTNAGFSVPKGPDFPHVLILGSQRGGGFYVDIGCSKLIASGAIKIKQGQEIKSITKSTMIFGDGTEVEADEIVMATGYTGVRQRTKAIFGGEVADAIDPIWGFDQQGESRGVWRRTGHPGFWVAAGNFWFGRHFSRLLALQIKAIEAGISEL